MNPMTLKLKSPGLVIRFESQKTPGEVYNVVIDTIDKAIDVVAGLASPELRRELILKLSDWSAKVENIDAKQRGLMNGVRP